MCTTGIKFGLISSSKPTQFVRITNINTDQGAQVDLKFLELMLIIFLRVRECRFNSAFGVILWHIPMY